MDGQMRVFAVVVGIVFILGTAFVVMSSNAFNYTPVPTSADFLATPNTPKSAAKRVPRRTPRNGRPTALAGEQLATRARLARLENLLEDRTNELKDRHERIDELNRQLHSLRTAAASSDPRDAPNSTSPENQSSATRDSQIALRAEIDRLNGELLNADIQEAEDQEQITALRDALSQANEKLDIFEDTAELQLSTSRRQGRQREAIIGDLVVRLGSDSVPLLIALLDEEDPNLRIWAIQVLGRFGEDAEEAVAEISSFFEDASPEVRAAAQKAIEAIEGR